MQIIFYILFLCFTCALSDNLCIKNDECAVNTHPFEKIGDKYYLVNTAVKMNWFEAAHLCRTYYDSDLATIESESELNELHTYLSKRGQMSNYFWFSGNDLATEGRYMSLSTGRPLTYVKWMVNQPDNWHEEDCLHLQAQNQRFLMNDYPCTGEGYSICELRKAFKTCEVDKCENVSKNCLVKSLVQAYLRKENLFNCRE